MRTGAKKHAPEAAAPGFVCNATSWKSRNPANPDSDFYGLTTLTNFAALLSAIAMSVASTNSSPFRSVAT